MNFCKLLRLSIFSCVVCCLTLSSITLFAGTKSGLDSIRPPFLLPDPKGEVWVDSIMQALTPEQRIGQLFMIAAYSNKGKDHMDELANLIQKNNIGGLIFFQGGPVRQAIQTNYYQSISPTPLLISIDGEWGLSMRLDSTMRFPKQMALGSIQDNTLIYDMGREIARQCRRLGIHINFAPVVDINNNPLNPIINSRSFGENKFNVAAKGVAYMKGLQDGGVLANAKHFPGHGDTDSDSHKTLPTIKHNAAVIDTLDLYPFRQLIRNGLGSMMVAHLYIPALDTIRNTASTLSKTIVTGLLKNKLGFQGLTFTDALNMKGVSSYFQPGKVDVKALLAGNDVLLFSENVPQAIEEINCAIDDHEISMEEIDQRVRKILQTKYWAGLHHNSPIVLKNLVEDLNTGSGKYVNRKLSESSLTLIKNHNNLLPLQKLDTLRIASIAIGGDSINLFQQNLSYYAPIENFQISKDATKEIIDTLLKKIAPYNTLIVSIHNTSSFSYKNYGITEQESFILNSLPKKAKVIVNILGIPYTLNRLVGAEESDALLISYEDLENPQITSAQVIFGALGCKGKLPVTAATYKVNEGINTKGGLRMKYTFPEELGIASEPFTKIDSIVGKGIKDGAMPGCQVLVAKDGKVIYSKSFGYHTYEKLLAVQNTDVYDIASVTKISSTLLGIMKLYDEHKIEMDKKVYRYLPELKNTNKKDMVLRAVLAHQAGLPPFIPFYLSTLNAKGYLSENIFRSVQSDSFPVAVAKGLYIQKSYADTMWKQIKDCPLREPGKYVYSDLGYYFMKRMLERMTKDPLEKYIAKNFYTPLGLGAHRYLPTAYFKMEKIIPSTFDTKFRKRVVHGYVNDPGAAMMGGVAGHAGIFSNANDLAIILQLFLNGGDYAGGHYFDKSTIEEFTKQQFPDDGNRRGMGFDKPEPDMTKASPAAKSASLKSFGHQGYTGTCVWADPDQNLIYVFLSNRVYPVEENTKLANMNIRTNIHQAIYDALKINAHK
jgi:beta-N-acetylhexosaminidase